MSPTPFQDARRAASAWIAGELCAPRGRAAPGLLLCRMRLTPARHASLGRVLRRPPRPAGLSPRGLAALFCPLAAEVGQATEGEPPDRLGSKVPLATGGAAGYESRANAVLHPR